MRHKNSFPPRLTEEEALHLSGQYTSEFTLKWLIRRGLMYIPTLDTPQRNGILTITKRGARMLARYQKQAAGVEWRAKSALREAA